MKTPAEVLVVDDEPVIRDTLAEFLSQEGFAVTAVGTGEQAVAAARRTKFDVALCDVHLPGLDGVEVLDRLARASPETAVVLITAYATVESAVEAFHKGACDYLMKPVLLPEVLGKVRKVLRTRDVERQNRWLRRELGRAVDAGLVVGRSPAMRKAVELARKAAPTATPVLLVGEPGTGKELLARAVHRWAQAARPTGGKFVPVKCAGVSADRGDGGPFAKAGAGTVFLDGVHELSADAQAELLQAVDRGVAPARLVAAAPADLRAAVADGRFRADLAGRLSVLTIPVPPLRDRREDIPELAEHLLAKHVRAAGKRVSGVSHEAMARLLAHNWPGNVRELENALQRAVIVADGPLVTPADLPPDLGPPSADDPSAVDNLIDAVGRFEKRHIERLLRLSADKKEAAKRLGIGLSSLYRKIEHHGIGLGPADKG